MATVNSRRAGLAVLVAGLVLVGAAGGRADEEKNPLREELLKLNSATTEDLQLAKLRALVKDREKAKKAIAEAAKMMKEAKDKDEKPFNYNGTAILARAAAYLREFDTAEKFYEHQVELATKVKNGKKMRDSYNGLIAVYFAAKRYADVVETCEKAV